MSQDLIERYIYAVTKRMPSKTRDDVSQELRGLIDDMLNERCGDMPPTEKDIRVVLTELGSPQELYEKYDEDSKKCLIGQPYYNTYKFVLKIVLICAAAGLTIANIVQQITEPQVWYAAAGNWLAMLWQGLMGSFAFVTLLFAVFYHKGIKLDEPFNFDDLPPVPKNSKKISTVESVFGIAISILFLVLFLAAPQVLCAIFTDTGEIIPIFSVDAIRNSWYIIAAFSLVGIIRETVKLMEKRYNKKVAVTSVAANAISAALSFWWLSGNDLINPVFEAKMASLFADGGNFVGEILTNFQYFFLCVILLALVLDTVTAIVKSIDK